MSDKPHHLTDHPVVADQSEQSSGTHPSGDGVRETPEAAASRPPEDDRREDDRPEAVTGEPGDREAAAQEPSDPSAAEAPTNHDAPGEELPQEDAAEAPEEAAAPSEAEEAEADEAEEDSDPSDDEEADATEAAAAEAAAEEEERRMDWYILKVQSNREKSITEALQRRIKIEGLEEYFGDIIVPTEKVTEFKGGKKRIVKRKLYPGYILVHMCINDDTWFLVRETPGIGDFTGSAGKPTPMLPQEVLRIVSKQEEKTDEAPKLKINFNVGDRVKINEGTFDNFEGEVSTLDEASGRVTVMINIFGRSTPVELEYWQVETI
ncbi:MAG: transcription termination/antitermination protein NusG [Pirellulales bacterium]